MTELWLWLYLIVLCCKSRSRLTDTARGCSGIRLFLYHLAQLSVDDCKRDLPGSYILLIAGVNIVYPSFMD